MRAFFAETRRWAPRRRDRYVREDDDVELIDPDEDRVIETPKPFFGGWR